MYPPMVPRPCNSPPIETTATKVAFLGVQLVTSLALAHSRERCACVHLWWRMVDGSGSAANAAGLSLSGCLVLCDLGPTGRARTCCKVREKPHRDVPPYMDEVRAPPSLDWSLLRPPRAFAAQTAPHPFITNMFAPLAHSSSLATL